MRVLLIHNHYGSDAPSGENVVFSLERQLLLAQNHEVRTLERHSDSIRSQGWLGMMRGGLVTPWNPAVSREMRRMFAEFRPHVVHAHNTFPLVSPAVFRAAQGAARVLTLHNYRLFCPAAIPLRNGRICTECMDDRSVIPAIRYGCYRGSRVATVPVAASVALHRRIGTWTRDVEAFVALTNFQRQRMTAAGLPEERVFVKPNFYPGMPLMVPWSERDHSVVFAGRLSPEKGVKTLVSAWLEWGAGAPPLVILGDGPLRLGLESRVREAHSERIRFLGSVGPEEAQRWIAQARLHILPSESFEGFPMVLREAFAFGTPSLASDLGPLPELVRDGGGVTFEAGNWQDLLTKARQLWSDFATLGRLSRLARQTFEERYTDVANYRILMGIYSKALDRAGVAVED